jgi:hypothetical protein
MRTLRAAFLTIGWVTILGGCDSALGDMAIHDLEPRAGASAGEQPVRIVGTGFRPDVGYTVYFGAARAQQVTIFDDTQLLVVTPEHEPGAVDVVIAADNGPAFRVVQGFTFNDQGGGVMEHVGESETGGAERY